MTIFIQVVLPVLLIFLSGYGIQKWKKLDIKPLSTVAIYILTPMLVFQTFYRAELNKQYAIMVLFSILLLVALIIVNKIYCNIRKHDTSVESGLILSTAFMNAGNYGAPIVLFAYGDTGFAYAVSFLVLQAIIMNFFGIYYAARGKAGIKFALKAVFEMPPTYAVLLALILNVGGIKIPENILSAVDLVGPATIPLVMVILGMQLAEIKLTNMEWDKISFGVMTRLFLSPLIAFGIILLIPMDPILQKVLILSAAMPSAATTVLYAVQYETEPDLVSSVTLITTIVSIFSITFLLILLG
ncbi:AEC family transporter [Cytobacillus sp. S13-E01]|uniref:AEC family transporter n=1 Tax=Cytobacillus sp. S13-E01 TaxID=3031326 RepID=UPI0023D88057|nr:AEC family transporter [Cytobacillus sp. S13-E01]MDF0727308.1 AEC family transporter [Cytobacillus sp. S13-E01]